MNSIEFAINMEIDGAEYYKKQAEINKNNALYPVFLLLAKDEEAHVRILQNRMKDLPYELQDNNTLQEFKSVFEDVADFDETKESLKQLDLYKEAQEIEKHSIELYKNMLAASSTDEDKMLFETLIKQESEHYAIFDQLLLFLNRPDAWPESAEFGLRDEY